MFVYGFWMRSIPRPRPRVQDIVDVALSDSNEVVDVARITCPDPSSGPVSRNDVCATNRGNESKWWSYIEISHDIPWYPIHDWFILYTVIIEISSEWWLVDGYITVYPYLIMIGWWLWGNTNWLHGEVHGEVAMKRWEIDHPTSRGFTTQQINQKWCLGVLEVYFISPGRGLFGELLLGSRSSSRSNHFSNRISRDGPPMKRELSRLWFGDGGLNFMFFGEGIHVRITWTEVDIFRVPSRSTISLLSIRISWMDNLQHSTLNRPPSSEDSQQTPFFGWKSKYPLVN